MKTTRRSLASRAFAHLRKFWKRRKEASDRAARRGFFFEPLENRSLLAADFLAIPDQTVLQGAPLWLGVDGTSSVNSPITYTVTSSNPNVVAVTVPTGNRTLVLDVANFGTMKVQLFDNLAPRATTAIANLANAGFYNGLTFHRIINDFMIQGGAADGAGGPNPNVPDFDDQYNPDLQFTSPGLIAMAKGLDDSNDTQFFITDTVSPPFSNFPRHLDFNHTIFGKLTEGDSVREAISNAAVSGSTPTTPVIITSATVLNNDTENTAFMLKALASSGSAAITITATDGQGAAVTRTFNVTVAPDTSNGNPYLSDLPTVKATVGASTVPIQLQGVDVEGDAIYYNATKIGSVNYTVAVNNATGLVTVTPPVGFVGSFDVQVSAKALAQQNTVDTNQAITDVQKVTVHILPTAPTGLDLLAASDTGTSSSDNITNASSLQFQANGVTSGAVIRLYAGTNVLAQTTASGTTATITFNNIASLGEGVHNFTMTQEVSGEESAKSAPLAVTYDVTPPGAFTSTAPTTAETGTLYTYDAENASPNTGITYSLSPGITGATINSSTGVVSWTPSVAQVGTQTFGIVASDAAGNTINQGVSVAVAQAVTKVAELSLSITDATAGRQPITTLHVGDNFYLRGSVRDLRTSTVQGVYALFADLNYDPAKVQVTGAVEFNGGYLVATSGDTTTSGLVNEVGAVSSSTVPINAGLKLMFEIPMKVLAGGQFSFTTDPADVFPAHDVLLFGQDPPVPTAAVKYGSLTLSVDTTFTAVNDTFTVSEDAINSPLAVLSNDTIVPGSGNVLTILSVGPRDRAGAVTISADAKSLLYSPALNYNGPETFTYTVKNQNNETSTATVTVNVTPVNDAPTAVADSFSVPGESTGNVLDVLQNDSSSPDTGETLKVTAVTQGNRGGSVQIGTGGTFINYSPAANFEGVETFTYTISDGNGGTAQAAATVTVTHVNHNPVAVADTATVLEDSGATTINVLANDNTGIDTGETLTITGKGTPSNGGTVTIAADLKSLSYTPAANFQGIETFTYTISDGNGGTATGTVTVTVTNVNDAPTAVADTLAGFKNTANVFDVLANDLSAPDPAEVFSITSVTQPSHGTVSITNNGTRVTYTPTTDYTGADSFTYTMQDPGGLTSTATVSVTVQDFIPSKLRGRVFNALDGTAGGLQNVVINLSGTTQGGQTVSRSTPTLADGSYLFENLAPGNYKINQVQPAFLVNGTTFVGTQGGTISGNDEISVVLGQNVTGLSNNFSELGKPRVMTRIDEYFATNLSHNVLAAVAFATPANTAAATFGTPVAAAWKTSMGNLWSQFHDFKFARSGDNRLLQVEVRNQQNQLLRATVSLDNSSLVLNLGQQTDGTRLIKLVGDPANFHFAPVPNIAPTAAADALSINSGATASINVASNDSDSDGTLNFASLAITQAPDHGTATSNNDGTVTYAHDGSAGANDSFKYTIADNQGAVSNEAQVTISVNQLPVANPDSATLAAGATQTINVAANDTDTGGTLSLASIVIVTQPTHGNVAVNTDGTVTYQHDNSASTTDSFTYRISDNLGAQSNVATVDIAIGAGEEDLFGGLVDNAHLQAVDAVLADETHWTI